ncbi:MAG: hypothetical protein ABL982_13480 [Vicinamibacterales bacterium]
METDYVSRMRQFVCGLHGHDRLLQFERARLSLKCTSCGHETPGWNLHRTDGVAPPEPVSAPRRRVLPSLAARRLASQ